jgi:hypothetical protein
VRGDGQAVRHPGTAIIANMVDLSLEQFRGRILRARSSGLTGPRRDDAPGRAEAWM